MLYLVFLVRRTMKIHKKDGTRRRNRWLCQKVNSPPGDESEVDRLMINSCDLHGDLV